MYKLKNENGRSGFYVLLLAIGLVLGLVAGGETVRRIYNQQLFGAPQQNQSQTDSSNGQSSQPAHSRSTMDDDVEASRHNAIVRATQRVAPCVVGVVVTQMQVVGNTYYSDFFDLFFAPKMVPRYREVQNMGSGFLISSKGLVVTNDHVVNGAVKLYINFPDGRQVEGKVVGRDPYSDIALIAVHGEKFPSVKLGNSDDILIAEWVIAIGNPFLNFFNDPRPTVTVGVVSALNRNFSPGNDVYYQNMIQTDASINPGNSGGPLVNARGEVIGINTFIYTGSGQNRGSIGIGFAIPINRVRRVTEELQAYGRRRPVWTGITVQDIDRAIAMSLGFTGGEGVAVTDVARGSPGDVAGLKPGDVIVRMGDRSIRSHTDIEGFFLDYFIGDVVVLTVARKGSSQNIRMTLREYPSRR